MKIAVLKPKTNCGVGKHTENLIKNVFSKFGGVIEIREGDVWSRHGFMDVETFENIIDSSNPSVLIVPFEHGLISGIINELRNCIQYTKRICPTVMIVHGIDMDGLVAKQIRFLSPDAVACLKKQACKVLFNFGIPAIYVTHGCNKPIRRRFGSNKLLAYGTIYRWKNYEFCLALRKWFNIDVIVFRSEKYDYAYEKELKKQGVTVRNWVNDDELRKIILEHDVVLAPYVHVNWCCCTGKLYECAQYSTPLLASDSLLCNEVAEVCPSLVTPLNIWTWRERIQHILKHIDEYSDFMYEFALKNTWDIVYEQFKEVLQLAEATYT